MRGRFDAALVALGRLDAVTDHLANAALLLYSFVRKVAVLSSMIEGTQSSLADLMLFELDEQPGVPVEDAREVSRYVAALEHGLKRLRGGFPLSLRLMREVHKVLMGSEGRGANCTIATSVLRGTAFHLATTQARSVSEARFAAVGRLLR